MKILLIEDEKYITKPIEQMLKKNNYSIDVAYDGEYGLDCALTNTYDIVILDILLPKMDGYSVLKEMRKNGIKAPVLMLTAKCSPKDKVYGLDSGADDYLAKPFDNNELLARLRALSRRKGELILDGILRLGKTELNPLTLMLVCQQKTIKLKLKEAQLLELFMNRKNITTSKDMIIEKIWGYDTDAEDGNVEYHISLLRKKLATINADISIRTIRNLGYVLESNEVKNEAGEEAK